MNWTGTQFNRERASFFEEEADAVDCWKVIDDYAISTADKKPTQMLSGKDKWLAGRW